MKCLALRKRPLLAAALSMAATGFLSGCSSTDPTQPRPLPSSVLNDLASQSAPPEQLGFHLDRTGRMLVGPRAGYLTTREAVPVSFSLDRGWPAISAKLNGTFEATLVVDTGAFATSLAGRTAASARVRTISTNNVPPQLVRGVGGTERTVMGIMDRLSIGGLDVTNLPVNVRLEETPRAGSFGGGPRIENLLGLSPVLAGLSYLTIDYPQKTVTFGPGKDFPGPAAGPGIREPLRVPFELSRDGLRIDLGFSNSRRAPFIVDTGYSGEILMSGSTTQIAGAAEAIQKGRQGAIRGIGGELMQIGFTLDWIELGGRRFGYVKAATGAEHDLIGSGWLRQFRVTFDFKNRVMWLE